jgi:succinate dehydrogenase / fumarate reductase iron-sulfur subunit
MSAPPHQAALPETSRSVRLRVSRFKRGDARPHFDEFTVQAGPRTTILDALTVIRRDRDPSLILRHSCYHASCGTCGMRVNDREVLACVTKIRDLDSDEIKVEPIANQALVADLVTDMVDFYARFNVARRALIRRSDTPDGVEPPGIEAYNRYENCIECGLCTSACPILGSDARYLGPAALAAAWRTVEEPRGVDVGPVLRLTDDPQGSWRCHEIWECSEACPSNVDPAGKIMLLRGRQARDRLRWVFGGGRTKP